MELTKILVQITLPKAVILASGSPRVVHLSQCSLVPITWLPPGDSEFPPCIIGDDPKFSLALSERQLTTGL